MTGGWTFRPIVARDLQPGQHLRRASLVWTLTAAEVNEGNALTGPYVRLACIDHRGEIREFTLPADLVVMVSSGE